ncbi:hypothetical protein OH687_02395 [Burkholderia anthina]|nr:hypothetical protein OH687_02395 [Burkholderia anthina]
MASLFGEEWTFDISGEIVDNHEPVDVHGSAAGQRRFATGEESTVPASPRAYCGHTCILATSIVRNAPNERYIDDLVRAPRKFRRQFDYRNHYRSTYCSPRAEALLR